MSSGNLVPKQIIDKNGKITTVWVSPDQDMSGFNTPASVSAPPTLSSSTNPVEGSPDTSGHPEESDEDVMNDLHDHASESGKWSLSNSGEIVHDTGVWGSSLDQLEGEDGIDLTTKIRIGTSADDSGDRSYYVVSEGFDGPMEDSHQAEGLDASDWDGEGWQWDSRNQRYYTKNRDVAFAVPKRAADFAKRANMESYEDFRRYENEE